MVSSPHRTAREWMLGHWPGARGACMGDTIPEPRKLVAEFVGTFVLIFVGAGSIVLGGSLLVVALAHGLAIALMVSALGHISGGLFNPALTVGLWVTRRLTTLDTVTYIAAQLLGAIVGALLLLVYPGALRDAADLGTPVLGSASTLSGLVPGIKIPDGVNFAQGVLVEVVLTAFLMLAVFGTALDRRGPNLGGFGIGLVITMSILAAGPITGAAMNPARVLGPALVSGTWTDHPVYWIGPIIGAVLAALLYHFVLMDQSQRTEAEESEAAAA